MDNKYFKVIDTAANIISPGSRCTISKIVEDSVKDVLINKYGDDWNNNKELFFNCYESLRKNFNKENYKGDIPYFYSMYYMLLNIPKVQLVLLQLLRKKKSNRKLNILDIGSSVGTSSIAILDLLVLLDNLCELYEIDHFFDDITVSSIEASKDNIKVWNENLNYFKGRLNKVGDIVNYKLSKPLRKDITIESIEGKFDLIIISNVLNELEHNQSENLLFNCLDNLERSGEIIIIEPASQHAAKHLNYLKTAAFSKGLFSIAPCGICNQCSNCWTYRTSDVVNGELIKYIDNLYSSVYKSKFDEFHNNRLKWCYCILSKDCEEDKCTNIADAYNKKLKSAKVNIVSSRENNSYKICDSHGNRAILTGNGIQLGFYNYGDFIILDNIEIIKGNEYRIVITEQSIISSNYVRNERKYNFRNIKEKNILYILNRLYGFDSFREGQFEIISNALMGKDILGILPTGAGKSVCYQLPAMLCNGVSIIVSPLKSLIKDQVNSLKKIGFEYVDFIDSSQSAGEKRAILNRFKTGSLKLLYVSPERLQMREFQIELIAALKNFSIDYFIIDEAHCASEWGHDFRPSYLKLSDMVEMLEHPNIIAVTATASPKVKEDVLEIFNIPAQNVINSKSINRNEISLEVINVPITENKDKYLEKVLVNDIPSTLHRQSINDLNQNSSGIIFTIYAETVAKNTKYFGTNYILDEVRDLGIEANKYNSKMSEDEKINVQNEFMDNKFPLLVSTKGFGMGIDKPNIRYVIHMCYSNSLEAYYQEAGRAGRDREHSHSVIIARSRTEKCIKNQINIDSFEPRCINSWKCSYSDNPKCDYGMQAKFISDAYEDSDKMKENLFQLYKKLMENYNDNNKFKITISKTNEGKVQKYLYYFQKYKLIVNYVTLKYISGGDMQIGIVVGKDFRDRKIENIINDIIARLQTFKKQKYNMLQSMWEYVNNKDKCRRQFLMDYFQDNVSFGTEGCKFCDVEGISEERTISVNHSLKINKMFDSFSKLLTSNSFDYMETNSLLKEFYEVDKQENVKIRAMRYLEDYTNNPTALYFASMITLKRDKEDAYAKTQAFELINIISDKSSNNDISMVINEIQNIDVTLAERIIFNVKDISNNQEILFNVCKEANNERFKNILFKMYLNTRIKDINNRINGRIANGNKRD